MTEIQSSPYRYVNLVLFMLAGFCNAFPTNSFSSVGPIIMDVYEVDEIFVNINAMIFGIMYVLCVFPINYILERYGLKIGLAIGEVCFIVGLLIRFLMNQSFYLFLVGTWVTSFGYCFMLNSANKFATSWFPSGQIGLSNSLCLISLFLSDSLGSFVSSLFIHNGSTKQTILHFFIIESIIMIVIQVLMLVLFRGKPDHPPNYASEVPREKEYCKSLRKLLKNRNYMILFASMTFIYASLSIFVVTLAWQLQVYGFGTETTGALVIMASVCGCASSVIVGAFFSRTYRKTTTMLTYLGLFSVILCWVGMELHQEWLLYVTGAGIGISIMPYLTTMTDFASQTAFPIGEAVSAGSLLFGGQLFGVLMAIILSVFFFDGQSLTNTRIGQVIEVLIVVIGSIILHFSKQELNREKYEEEQQIQAQSGRQSLMDD